MSEPITVVASPELAQHLREFYDPDGGNVADLLFEGGRLSYPGRRELEHQLGQPEPYTLELEARVIHGLPRPMNAAIHMLAVSAEGFIPERLDPTLELLWDVHAAWAKTRHEPSPDRLVAALVCVQHMLESPSLSEMLEEAADILVTGLYERGFPPSHEALEELFDGAFPASVGLGLVEVP